MSWQGGKSLKQSEETPGLSMVSRSRGVPDQFIFLDQSEVRLGHEAHFGRQVRFHKGGGGGGTFGAIQRSRALEQGSFYAPFLGMLF